MKPHDVSNSKARSARPARRNKRGAAQGSTSETLRYKRRQLPRCACAENERNEMKAPQSLPTDGGKQCHSKHLAPTDPGWH